MDALNKKPIIEYVHPDYRNLAIERIKRVIKGEKQSNI